MNHIDEVLQRVVKDDFATGVSALVYYKGREVYYGEYGVRNIASGERMKRDTIFRLYSMSKPITAVATMLLIERGIIRMEDPVERYLPEYDYKCLRVLTQEGTEVPVTHSITIWDLLHMTSGIPYPDEFHKPGRKMGRLFQELIAAREHGEVVTTREYARRIAQLPLCFQPGTDWMYGLSADILGAVIEQATGERFDVFLQREIFEPLGMTDTGFFVPAEKRDRFAAAYEWNENNQPVLFERSFLGEYYGEDVAFLSGGAGLVSTVDDYMRFVRMLSGRGALGQVRILKPETIEYMRTDHLEACHRRSFTWETMTGYGYSCLMRTLVNPEALGTPAPVGEFGWDGWMGCYMQADPLNDLSLVYMIQRCGAGTTDFTWEFRNAVYREYV